jgi:putative sigma-54 modulation protein
MELIVSYHNMESSAGVESHIREKCEKLKKYLDGNFKINWTCEVNKLEHKSHVTITGKDMNYHADAVEDNLYKTIDSVLAKLEKQVAKKKEMMTNKIHRS